MPHFVIKRDAKDALPEGMTYAFEHQTVMSRWERRLRGMAGREHYRRRMMERKEGFYFGLWAN